MGWCTLKVSEEKSKDAGFAQRNGFGGLSIFAEVVEEV